MHRAQGAQESSANILQGCTREQQLKCTVNKVVNTPLGCFNTLFSLQLKTHALIQGSASIPRSMFNLYLPQLNTTFFFTIRERPVFRLQDELFISDVTLTQSLGLHNYLTGVLQGLICWVRYEVLAHCATETLKVPNSSAIMLLAQQTRRSQEQPAYQTQWSSPGMAYDTKAATELPEKRTNKQSSAVRLEKK